MILGNPPYNGFAGMAVDEERELSTAYRRTERVRRPEGHGLNDLYVRFFRMAERRIAEKAGRRSLMLLSSPFFNAARIASIFALSSWSRRIIER